MTNLVEYHKGSQIYFFRYAIGEEQEILAALCNGVVEKGGLDWYDAALISRAVGQLLAEQINHVSQG
jgi:hypothetical protein